MKYLWSVTLDDYEKALQLAKFNGKQPGDSIELEFLQVMKEKNQKPIGATELTPNELIKEYTSKGKNMAHLDIDEKGKTKIRTFKKLDKD